MLSFFGGNKSFSDGLTRRIVIVGGGYGGVLAAQKLSKSLKDYPVEITLLEKRDKFYHAVGGVRGISQAGFEKVLWIPYDKFATGNLKVRTNTEVQSIQATEVITASGESIPFEYCVIATGGNNREPAKFATKNSSADAQAVFRKAQDAVKGAQSYLIVGGGAVGCEIAGELLTDYPGRSVTIVHSGPKLLHTSNASDAFRDAVKAKLEAMGAKIILNERVELSEEETRNPEFVVKGKRVLRTSRGKEIESDLQFISTGNSSFNGHVLSTSFPSLLLKSGEIKAKTTMQVDDASVPWLYTTADVSSAVKYKTIGGAMFAGGVAVDNIITMVKAEAGSTAKRNDLKSRRDVLSNVSGLKTFDKPMVFNMVMLGRNGGKGELPMIGIVGDWALKMMKSKDGMAGNYWKELGQEVPMALK